MGLGLVILLGAFAFTLCLVFKDRLQYRNLPPGPTALPFIGSLPFITKSPHLRFSEWAQKYGAVVRIKLFSCNLILINDPKVSKEAFNNPLLLAKPDFMLFNVHSEGKYGLFTTKGNTWSEQRRFTLRQLRDFGFGKRSLQELYLTEVMEFVEMMKKSETAGEPICLNDKFGLAAINSLWMIMTGTRFRLDDEEFNAMVKRTEDAFQSLIGSPIAIFWPNLARKFPKMLGWNKFMAAADEFASIMKKPVAEHVKDFEAGEAPRDFIDAYLNEIEKTTDAKSSFHKNVGVKNLELVIGELWGGGTGTTAQTLNYAILYLCKWPQIQKKLQAEIDRVVGKSRAVTLEDRQEMPYTEAFIQETLRKSSITPYGIFHSAEETTELNGVTIPKGAWVGINIYHMHHDPRVWEEPMKFMPERWLNADGSVDKSKSVVAFSVGRRMCIGEQLARDGVFLFLTNIFQRFEVKFDPAQPEPTLEGTMTMFADCDKYHVLLKDRT